MRFVLLPLLLLAACSDAVPATPDAAARDASSPEDGGPTDGGAAETPDGGPPGEWQLEPGHFHPAVMPMTLSTLAPTGRPRPTPAIAGPTPAWSTGSPRASCKAVQPKRSSTMTGKA